MAKIDEETMAKRLATCKDLDLPLSSAVSDELGEFLKRFRAMICRAGYCCLDLKREPDAWAEYVFELRLERIPKPSERSRAWERYKVVSARKIHIIRELIEKGDGFITLVPQFKRYHEENERVGCIGTVTTFIVCDSAGEDVRCISWGGYGPDAWNDIAPGEDWLETVKEEVERLAGRSK